MNIRFFGHASDTGVNQPTRQLPYNANGMNVGQNHLYAIMLRLDDERISSTCGDPSTEIRRVLQRHGFNLQQGSVYFGGESINAVTCVLAAIDLARELPWFSASVRDIRMLRIEELNDLMPAIQQAGPQ